MEFAELLPKKITKEEDGELVFCSTAEGVKRISEERPAGKLLFVTDASSLGAFRTCLPPRSLCLVLDSDGCLPLFHSSDEFAFVAAAGKESTLCSARFFAEVRKIPCAVFPVSATLDGAYERKGTVRFDGKSERVPLREAAVFCDGELMRTTAGQAYMRLLLARLAIFEAKALRRFGADCGREEAEERAYAALLPLREETLSFASVAAKNAEIRQCERDGMNRGEGVILASSIGRGGEEQAFFLLSALYSAFFERGKPRLIIPDYAARALRAEAPYSAQRVPAAEELFRRASRLERMRSEFFRELDAFLSGVLHYRNNFFSLTGCAVSEPKEIAALETLPERSAGLSAVIRDFGLMEWQDRGFAADIL